MARARTFHHDRSMFFKGMPRCYPGINQRSAGTCGRFASTRAAAGDSGVSSSCCLAAPTISSTAQPNKNTFSASHVEIPLTKLRNDTLGLESKRYPCGTQRSRLSRTRKSCHLQLIDLSVNNGTNSGRRLMVNDERQCWCLKQPLAPNRKSGWHDAPRQRLWLEKPPYVSARHIPAGSSLPAHPHGPRPVYVRREPKRYSLCSCASQFL